MLKNILFWPWSWSNDKRFYWHRRAVLIAEVRPEVHPIHPVQSTYGFWAFKPVYTDFRSIWASQLQSMEVWSTVDFFYFHYINKNSFQKENRHYEIAAYLCYTWSIFWIFYDKTCIIHSFFSRKRVKSEMLSLFSRNEKWICFSFHSFREWKVKWKCLEIEIESEKWNENASRSRSRSEIGKKFSRILEKRDSRRLLKSGDKKKQKLEGIFVTRIGDIFVT